MNEDELLKILSDLQVYNRPKNELLLHYVQERLNKNLISYYKKLSQSVEYLAQRNSKNVLNRLNK